MRAAEAEGLVVRVVLEVGGRGGWGGGEGGGGVVCGAEREDEMVDEGKCVDRGMNVEPELLKREVWGSVEGVLELGEESLVVLRRR